MKKSDIAAIILIASLSMGVAYFIASTVIAKPTGNSVKVKTATEMTAKIKEPSDSIFNEDAINPTVEVMIGN